MNNSGTKLARERERLKAYILEQAPADLGTRLDIDYDGKIKLLGARVEPRPPVKPGTHLKLTLYWLCVQKLAGEWNLFTHVLDGSGERIVNIDNIGPLRERRDVRQALPPDAWQPGKVYVDEQVFEVPATLQTRSIQIVTGIWSENARLPIRSGAQDNENRGIVATLPTTGMATLLGTRVPALNVPRLLPADVITLDGKLDEPAWAGAADSGLFVDVGRGLPNTSLGVDGRVKLLWNDQGFYTGFNVSDPTLTGGFDAGQRDPHLWTRDTVELMIDPEGDGDNKDYFEIQINPQNLVFDSHFSDYNQPRVEPDGPFGEEAWASGVKSAVGLDGTLDQPGDRDRGYVVEAFFPWRAFAKAARVPPASGVEWRMNFYAMENNNGVAWSPILGQGNFHKASRFGRVIWVDSSAPAQPQGAANAQGAAGERAGAGAPGERR